MADNIVVQIVLEGSLDKQSNNKIESEASKLGQSSGNAFSASFKKEMANLSKVNVGIGDALLKNVNSFQKELSTSLAGTGKISAQSFGLAFKNEISSFKSAFSDVFNSPFTKVALVGAAFASLSSSIKQSVDTARSFNVELARINSILPQTEKLTESTVKQIEKFSSSYGTDLQTQARAFYNIVSSGIVGTTKQLDVLAVSNRAAVAGLTDIDVAAKLINASLNSYTQQGLSATKASDALFVAVREGVTTFGELSDSFGRVTPLAASAGLEFSEAAGAVAFLTKAGIQTSEAVTGLRAILAEIIKPSKDSADEAKRLGLEFNTTALRAKGLAGFFEDVREKTKGNEQSLSRLFGRVEALNSVLTIANSNADDFNRILKETANSSGATREAFDQISKSADFNFKQLDSALALINKRIGETLIPYLASAARGFAAMLPSPRVETDLSKINDKLGKTASEINKIQDQLKGKVDFNSISTAALRSKEDVDRLNLTLIDLREKRKQLLAERSTLLSPNNEQNAASKILDINRNLASSIVQVNEKLLSDLGNIGLTKIQILDNQYAKELEILRLSLEEKLLSEQDYEARKTELTRTYSIERQDIVDQEKINTLEAFKTMGETFAIVTKSMKQNAGEFARTMLNVFASSIGNAFTRVGQALAAGKDGFKAFGESLKLVLGDIAGAAGDMFIKWGLANIASQNYAIGAAQLSAGGALKILGGYLGASGSGAPSGGGGGSASRAFENPVPVEEQFQQNNPVQAQKQTNLNLTVQGNVIGDKSFGKYVADALNEANAKEGITLLGVRTV